MHRARTVSVVSSPLDAQTRRFGRPPTGLTVERAERGSPNSNTRGRTTVEVRTGMQIAARRHWHGVRANMTEGSAGLPTLADPSGSQHGWPSREQDVPFRFGAAQYRPHGTPGRYPAKPYDPEKRISPPCATLRFSHFRHFAWGAYAFLGKMVKMSSQSCRRRVRHPIRPKTEGGGAARRWQGTASANVRLL